VIPREARPRSLAPLARLFPRPLPRNSRRPLSLLRRERDLLLPRDAGERSREAIVRGFRASYTSRLPNLALAANLPTYVRLFVRSFVRSFARSDVARFVLLIFVADDATRMYAFRREAKASLNRRWLTLYCCARGEPRGCK